MNRHDIDKASEALKTAISKTMHLKTKKYLVCKKACDLHTDNTTVGFVNKRKVLRQKNIARLSHRTYLVADDVLNFLFGST